MWIGSDAKYLPVQQVAYIFFFLLCSWVRAVYHDSISPAVVGPVPK